MMAEKIQSPQSEDTKSCSFSRDEIDFLQCEVDSRSLAEYEKITGKGVLGRNVVRDDLEENFCGKPEIHGLWLATVEAIKQDRLNTALLRLNLSEPLTERETRILEFMVSGKRPLEISDTMDMRVGYVKLIIRQFVRKMGFVNTIQAVAWVASEKKKAGEL